MYRHFTKRLLDIIFSALLLVALSPLLAVIAIIIYIKFGKPIIFRHIRPGKNAKEFTLYKFRTMTDATDEKGNMLPDAERLTRFGAALRRTSLDELPELLNILSGSMSFVGPRPLLVKYLPRYSERQRRRHEVRPGLTGWAQVNGRNAIGWNRKFEYDVEYADKVSFHFDVLISFKTIGVILRREGISENGEATMSEFMGESED
jgi:undecaprenyl phosphate N,N'-diacetylbacillosamine 1-phosphate transferase